MTKLILALDVNSREAALHWVKLLYPKVKIFKVGLQLFTACGPQIIRDIRKSGADIFLDLKFNDIPNTMVAAVKEARKLKVTMLTVHTLSGPSALKRVSEACGSQMQVLGVTILTSICPNFLKDLRIQRGLSEQALYLAKMAKSCGLDGVICSPLEAAVVRKNLGKNFTIVSPGIRANNAPSDDQNRTATAGQAAAAGVDYIVVGRPILKAKDPLKAAQEIIAEMG